MNTIRPGKLASLLAKGEASALQDVDKWVRGRLRSILRKRSKRKGRARGKDHYRWPNRFFDEAGLFNLSTARAIWAASA